MIQRTKESYAKELEKRAKIKDEIVKELKLFPLMDFSNIYVDLDNQQIYSFIGKTLRILKGGKGTTGYRVFSLRADGEKKHKTYGRHEIMYSAAYNKRIKSWRAEGKIIHHKDNNCENDFYLNLCEIDEKEHQRLKKNKKPKGKLNKEQVIKMRRDFELSNLSRTKFAMENAEKYGISVIHMMNVLAGRVWKEKADMTSE